MPNKWMEFVTFTFACSETAIYFGYDAFFI